MRKHIPNIITLLNLLSGCIATVMAFQGAFKSVVFWVIVAALFDFLDGFIARLLKAPSEIGKELDSLADMVSFGIAPSASLFILMRDYISTPPLLTSIAHIIPYFAFIVSLFSAYRLAKFNLDERQSSSFLGLPTPANGLFWISYCYSVALMTHRHILLLYLTLLLICLLSILMISELPMYSLKIKKIQFRGNEYLFILFFLSAILIITYGISGISWSVLIYIALSTIAFLYKRKTKA